VTDRKPVADLTDRELLGEIAEDMRHLRAVLDGLGPLIELGRALGHSNGGPPMSIRIAGMRRAMRKAHDG
jgi:hypothetical protein